MIFMALTLDGRVDIGSQGELCAASVPQWLPPFSPSKTRGLYARLHSEMGRTSWALSLNSHWIGGGALACLWGCTPTRWTGRAFSQILNYTKHFSTQERFFKEMVFEGEKMTFLPVSLHFPIYLWYSVESPISQGCRLFPHHVMFDYSVLCHCWAIENVWPQVHSTETTKQNHSTNSLKAYCFIVYSQIFIWFSGSL